VTRSFDAFLRHSAPCKIPEAPAGQRVMNGVDMAVSRILHHSGRPYSTHYESEEDGSGNWCRSLEDKVAGEVLHHSWFGKFTENYESLGADEWCSNGMSSLPMSLHLRAGEHFAERLASSQGSNKWGLENHG